MCDCCAKHFDANFFCSKMFVTFQNEQQQQQNKTNFGTPSTSWCAQNNFAVFCQFGQNQINESFGNSNWADFVQSVGIVLALGSSLLLLTPTKPRRSAK